MPVVQRQNEQILGFGGLALGAWAALLVTFAVARPFEPAASPLTHAPGAQLSIGVSGYGLAGPLAHSPRGPEAALPTLEFVRLSPLELRGLFAGSGAPSQRIVLLRAGKAIAETTTDANGKWQIAAPLKQLFGIHGYSVEQSGPNGSSYATSPTVHVHVPEGHYQTITAGTGHAHPNFSLVAVRAEAQDIGTASSKRFDELLKDGRVETDGSDAPTRTVQRTNDALEPAWNWLREANRSYNQDIVPRIKRGGGYVGGLDAAPESEDRGRSETAAARLREEERAIPGPAAWRATDASSDDRERRSTPADGFWSWLETSRRGYTTEVVPRLKGQMPDVRIARPGEAEPETETEAQRQARLESERRLQETATQRAERERLEAAQRRREAEERRQSAEEQAARLAEERRRANEESVRRLADEQRRVLERRAEEERLAAERRRIEAAARESGQTEAARVRAAEQARLQEQAEQEAANRQRLIDEAQAAADAERRRSSEETARRLADEQRRVLERRTEEERLAAERRRAQATRQAEEREAAARERAQNDEAERIRAAELARLQEQAEQEAFRRERLTVAARAAAEKERLRVQQARRDQLIAEAETIRRRREADTAPEAARERTQRTARVEPARQPAATSAPPLPQPSRSRTSATATPSRFVQRDTMIEIETATGSSNQPRRTSRESTLRRPTGGDTYLRRDTKIEIIERGSTTTSAATAQQPATGTQTAVTARTAMNRATNNPTQTEPAEREPVRIRSSRPTQGIARCHRAGKLIDPPGTYIVKRGDTLWTISRRHYRLGRLFPMIHSANLAQIKRARLIYPCQRLHLPAKP